MRAIKVRTDNDAQVKLIEPKKKKMLLNRKYNSDNAKESLNYQNKTVNTGTINCESDNVHFVLFLTMNRQVHPLV